MVDQSGRYNLGAIRDLLLDAFNAEELQQLFYFAKTPDLQAVPDQFAEGDSLPAMVRKAVRYCARYHLLDQMLAEVQAANPRAYEHHEAMLAASPSQPPAHTPAPTPAATPAVAPAPGAKPARVLGRIPVWGLVAAAVVVVALAVVLVLLLRGPGSEPVPTPTEKALVTDTPTESAVTDTPEVTITTAPIVTPTLTFTVTTPREHGYEYDPLLVVVYRGSDGVSLLSGPGTDYPEVDVAYGNDWLGVWGASEMEGVTRWWPVYSEREYGWVAEWTDDGTRLVKPWMDLYETVMVVNPIGSGDLSVYEDCETGFVVEWGTDLTVVGLPDPQQCSEADESLALMGRQWWLVETPEGWQGWVADFSDDVSFEWVRPMLIAPYWYVELTAPRGSTVW